VFVRQVTIDLRAGAITRFAQVIEVEVMRLLRQQDGFLDHVTMVSLDGTRAVVLTFWDDARSEEAFVRNRHPELLESLREVIDGSAQVDRFESISSTLYDRQVEISPDH
jgi:heme-degrading monooxygenase HmoA